MRPANRRLAAALSGAALVAAVAHGGAQQAPPAAAQTARAGGPAIEAIAVQGHVTMLAAEGGNVAVSVGDDGVIVVDTGSAAGAASLVSAIRQLAGDQPVRYIVNTSADADRTGGNEAVKAIGQTIIAGNVAMDLRDTGATIAGHEKVQIRMAEPGGGRAPRPEAAWPTETYAGNTDELFFNDEAVQLVHPLGAHTDGDSMIFFRKSDVIVTGSVFNTVTYPVVDVAAGGTINGLVAALNTILDLTVPRDKQEGGTMVIPGRGRLSDEADVVEYRDMVTIIRDRVQASIKKGLTLDQVKASRPTSDYDGRYGAASGPWTTDMFVEAVYRTLAPRGAGSANGVRR